MIDLQALGTMAGGLGLFLLGMGLMTDGLKLAAGPAFHRILAGATRTRAHALGSGMLVTALVQSVSRRWPRTAPQRRAERQQAGVDESDGRHAGRDGRLLMWPLAARPTRWLQQRFRAREEDEAQPQFHDDTVLAVPTLALDALTREVARAGLVALRMTRSALAGADEAALKADHTILVSLDAAIERFVERLRSASMAQVESARLAELLRIQRYHEASAEQAVAAAALPPLIAADARLAAAAVAFVEATSSLLLQCDPTEPPNVARLDTDLGTMEARYGDLKADLLAAGADARLALTDMEQALRRCSALRRAAQQLHKSRRRLAEGVTP